MSFDVFETLVEGYEDHLIDLEGIAAQTGFWAAYYRSKRPKKLDSVLQKIASAKGRSKIFSQHVTDVDVETFKARELRREATYHQWEKV